MASISWPSYLASVYLTDERLFRMFNDLEMYLYRNHVLVVGGSGRVFIHAGQTLDAPLVAEAVNLDAAMLAVDAIKAGQDGMPAFTLLVGLGLLAQAGKGQSATPQ